MRHLFEEIVKDGEAVLQRLVAEEAQEDVDLEFKAKDASRPSLTDGDKRSIGKTLSAFSNSAGGLLIFGADARADKRGVDRLVALKPFADIDRILSEVRNLVGHLLLPRHDGIWVERVYASEPKGAGYLAIYAERSERRPHMSKAPDDGRYYKRSGTSSFMMEHFDIEDAFKRVTVPDLKPSVRMLHARMNGSIDNWIIPISLGLCNVGTILARFPYISVLKTNAYVIDNMALGLQPRWRLTRDPPGSQLSGGVDDVIHVGTTQIGAHLYVSAARENGRFTIFGDYYEDVRIHLDIQYGAEGFRGDPASIRFNGDDLHEAMRKGGALN